MRTAARVMGRHRLILPVPLLSPGLSSRWLGLITDVDVPTARALVASMTNEVIVHDDRINTTLSHEPMPFAEAVERALTARAARLGRRTYMRLPDILSAGAARRETDEAQADGSDSTARRGRHLPCRWFRAPRRHAARDEGSGGFIALGLAAAAVWVLGAFASGPIAILPSRPDALRPVVAPAAALGGAAFVVFLAARLIGDHLPVISDALDRILATADAGSLWVVLVVALVNGAAEELFFRGAVQAAVGPRSVLAGTLVYVAVTTATGNVTLVIAAAVMGTVFAMERRATGGVLASTVTHLTWSTLMILLLPR